MWDATFIAEAATISFQNSIYESCKKLCFKTLFIQIRVLSYKISQESLVQMRDQNAKLAKTEPSRDTESCISWH